MTVQLRQRDIKNLLTIGGVASECQTVDDLRDELLRRIQDALRASGGLFFQFSGDQWTDGRFHNGFSRVPSDAAPRAWLDGYWRQDPFVRQVFEHIKNGGDHVTVSSHVLNKRDYEKSSFYCDFLRPEKVYHILVAATVEQGRPTGVLGLHRPPNQRLFLQSDILKVSLLLPHLAAAVGRVSLKQKLHARQSIIDALADDLARPAVLMLDQTFRTVIANDYATRLLNGRSEEQLPADNIPPAIKEACKKLELQLVNPGQRQNHTAVTFSIDGKPMHGMVRVDTLDKNILRFIIYFGSARQNQLHPELMNKFGLSNRETDITQLVSFGLTNQEIADRLKISVHTVENHLRSIYSKVAVHNRTSLVSQLSRDH